MNAEQISLGDKQETLYNDILYLRALRVLLRDLFTNLNQHENIYDTLGQTRQTLEWAVRDAFIVTLSKIFDTTCDPNKLTLKSLIREIAGGVPQSAIADKKDSYIQKIEDVKRRLDVPRNSNLVHNSLSQVEKYPDRLWGDLESWTDLAEEIFMCCVESPGGGSPWPKTKESAPIRKLSIECPILLGQLKQIVDDSRAKR